MWPEKTACHFLYEMSDNGFESPLGHVRNSSFSFTVFLTLTRVKESMK